MPTPDPDKVRAFVRTRYAAIADGAAANAPTSCCGGPASSCCGSTPNNDELATRMGYGADELAAAGDGNLGLGCGNPQAIAALAPGEVVLDLGAGAGFDCFLAARQVGPEGRVIGVDMTPEMLAKAKDNAARLGLAQVEFRLGEIEHLPVADATVDVAISNCAINLSPDKPQVFREVFRVLKPGGRVAVSDVVQIKPFPPELAELQALFTGCVTGAASAAEIEDWLRAAGFTAVRIEPKPESRDLIRDWAPGLGIEDYVASAVITARKPG